MSCTISISIFVSFLAILLSAPRVESARAFFVFGDSLVDVGNNNYLATIARADTPPYGIDFPTHQPTGRFSNGYTIPDLISQHMGAELTLPYLSPELTGNKLLVGANFASAGIGILQDTGYQFANIIRMPQQLQNFQQYQQRLASQIGQEQAKQLVNSALVLVTVGGNDFVNNYFLTPVTVRRLQYNLEDYSEYVVSEFKKLLKSLYDLGARRVLVTNTGPIGCVPAEIAQRGTNGNCAEEIQRAAAIFNPLVTKMIEGLNKEIGSDVFISVKSFQLQSDFIQNPQAFGFVTSKIACCGQGPYNGLGLCTAVSPLCPNRDQYAFWDAFHTSERANRIIVDSIVSGTQEFISPMNLSTIMAMDRSIYNI